MHYSRLRFCTNKSHPPEWEGALLSLLGWVRGSTKAYIGQKSISFDGHTHNYAAASHNHSASQITSGTLPVARGGTGVTSLDALKNALGVGTPTGWYGCVIYSITKELSYLGRCEINNIPTLFSAQVIIVLSDDGGFCIINPETGYGLSAGGNYSSHDAMEVLTIKTESNNTYTFSLELDDMYGVSSGTIYIRMMGYMTS